MIFYFAVVSHCTDIFERSLAPILKDATSQESSAQIGNPLAIFGSDLIVSPWTAEKSKIAMARIPTSKKGKLSINRHD